MTARAYVTVLLCALSAGCSARVVRLDTGQGEPLEHRLPAASKSVKVDAHAFRSAQTELMLSAPLELRSPQQGWLVRASYPSDDEDAHWRRLMGKSFGGLCAPGERREDCLSLLDDVMGLSKWDKLGVGLALSLEPMKESIAKAVEDTLAPQLFYTVIATGIIGWAVLAANPEPVFTKAAAIVTAVLLIYLGVDVFLELVDACRELKRATDRATTPVELAQAGQRFGNRVGPEVSRVVVLAVTAVVSGGMTGGAQLASRLALLPRSPEASAAGLSQVGIRLAQVGQVRQVAVVGKTVTISLPATAVAMAAQSPGGPQTQAGAHGQEHHVISKRIARELDDHPTLKGHYTERDPRFVTRAADKASHNGYQQWHRDVDDEVIRWLRTSDDVTPAQFEAFLRKLYGRPAMRARFPNGF